MIPLLIRFTILFCFGCWFYFKVAIVIPCLHIHTHTHTFTTINTHRQYTRTVTQYRRTTRKVEFSGCSWLIANFFSLFFTRASQPCDNCLSWPPLVQYWIDSLALRIRSRIRVQVRRTPCAWSTYIRCNPVSLPSMNWRQHENPISANVDKTGLVKSMKYIT